MEEAPGADTAEQSNALVTEFEDPDELAQVLRDADVRYLKLSSDRYAARITSVDFGAVQFQSVDESAHMPQGAIGRDRIALLYGLGPLSQDTRVNGATMDASRAIILGQGTPIYSRVGGRIQWAALTFNAAAVYQMLDEQALPRDGAFALHHLNHAAGSRLTRLSAEIDAIAMADPQRLTSSCVTRSLSETFFVLTARILEPGCLNARSVRALHGRIRLVAEAEAFMAAQLHLPLYSEDICAALDVSVRTLHDAFAAVHSMSLHRYLRLRRLNQVRSILRSGRTSQVKAAALTAGFWHLGRFAQAYRDLFGELPSQTLAHRRTPDPA